VQQALLARNILTGTSGDSHILRLLPPFTLRREHVDLLATALAEIPA
jgi:4-aminobutyrate aminotransferase-like enzyme